MLEALVVRGVQEDLGFELTTGMTVVHHLPPSALIPIPAATQNKHFDMCQHSLQLQATLAVRSPGAHDVLMQSTSYMMIEHLLDLHVCLAQAQPVDAK